jgi:predicted RecA/RadA family phage recombinase
VKNFVQPANVVTVRAPRDLKSGDGFVLGKLFGICTVDVKSGGICVALVEGGVALTRAAGVTVNEGDAVEFDETTQTIVATGGHVVGYCIEGISPDNPQQAWVKLIPTAATIVGP